jgi:hypothetical protein
MGRIGLDPGGERIDADWACLSGLISEEERDEAIAQFLKTKDPWETDAWKDPDPNKPLWSDDQQSLEESMEMALLDLTELMCQTYGPFRGRYKLYYRLLEWVASKLIWRKKGAGCHTKVNLA